MKKALKVAAVFLAGIIVATAALFGLSRNYEVPTCSRISELGQTSDVVLIGGASVDPLTGEVSGEGGELG